MVQVYSIRFQFASMLFDFISSIEIILAKLISSDSGLFEIESDLDLLISCLVRI